MVFGFKKKRTIDFTKLPADARRVPVKRDFKTQGDFVDLSDEDMAKVQNDLNSSGGSVSSSNVSSSSSGGDSSGGFGFLNSLASSGSSSPDVSSYGHSENSPDVLDIKRKMRDMTSKIEDSSNEVYRLTQKIELLEKKIERLEGGRGY